MGGKGKAKFPLSSHNGYTFGKWIEFDSDAFTVYGESVNASSANAMIDEPAPQSPAYQNISGGLVLKAAYTANISMSKEELSTPALRWYSLSNLIDPNDGYFGRYGTSSNYKVCVKVNRFNTNNSPVYRPRTTALRVSYNIDGVNIISLSNLKNVDEQIVEVAAPAPPTGKKYSVTFTIIDIGGVPDWATGAAARSDGFTVESDVYVLQGMVMYMNTFPSTIADLTSNFSAPSANDFRAAGLTVATSATARRTAVRNIAAAQAQKLADTGKQYLTLEEMQNAITYGNYLGS